MYEYPTLGLTAPLLAVCGCLAYFCCCKWCCCDYGLQSALRVPASGLLAIFPEVGTMDQTPIIVQLLENHVTVFCSNCAILHPTTGAASSFLHLLSHTSYFLFLNHSHLNVCGGYTLLLFLNDIISQCKHTWEQRLWWRDPGVAHLIEEQSLVFGQSHILSMLFQPHWVSLKEPQALGDFCCEEYESRDCEVIRNIRRCLGDVFCLLDMKAETQSGGNGFLNMNCRPS